jgi:hypothetical protein
MKSDWRKHVVSASAMIRADAARIYALLADYREGHLRILPPQFKGLTVERGGVGEGTVIQFQMRLLGQTRAFRAAITEPDPGRVLVETDLDTNGAVTTFTVDPMPGSGWSKVGITTEVDVRSGLAGKLERFLTTWLLQPIYTKQLEMLGSVAKGEAAAH